MSTKLKAKQPAVWLYRKDRPGVAWIDDRLRKVTYLGGGGWHHEAIYGKSMTDNPQADIRIFSDAFARDWKWRRTYRPKKNDSFVYSGDASATKADGGRYLQTVPDCPECEDANFKPENL